MDKPIPLIGVKFCGGCNPSYDRTKALSTIKESCKNADFQYVSSDFLYDYILVISGCTSMCADRSNLKSKFGFIELFSSSDIAAVIEKINSL